jgi:hypothetical protein
MYDHLSLGQCSQGLNVVARLSASSPARIALDAASYEWRSYFRPMTVTLALRFGGERARKLGKDAIDIMGAARNVTLHCYENEVGDLALEAYRAIILKLAYVEVLTITNAHPRLHVLLDNDVGHGLRRIHLIWVHVEVARRLLLHCTNVERLALHARELIGRAYDELFADPPPNELARLCPKLRTLSVSGAITNGWLENKLDKHISEISYTTSRENIHSRAFFVTSWTKPSIFTSSLIRLSIDSVHCTFKGHWPNIQQLSLSHVALRDCDIDISECPVLHTIVLTEASEHPSIVRKHHIYAFVTALLKSVAATTKRETSLNVVVHPLEVVVHPQLRLNTSSRHNLSDIPFRSVATRIRRLVKVKGDRRRIIILRAALQLKLDI